MSFVISLILMVAAAAFVAAPFFAPSSATSDEDAQRAGKPEQDRLQRQKLDAYAAIKEAEFDYRMGKLSEADFEALREKYSAQAVEAIAALEAVRARSRPPRRPTRIAFCPACGHGVSPRANFCPACGHSLKEAVA